MYFVNFICVFYLMVLCKGHTISKSDNIYDTNEYPDGKDFKEFLETNPGNVSSYLENKYFKKNDNKEANTHQPENLDNNFTEYSSEEPNDDSTNFWFKFTKSSKAMLDNDNYYVKQDYSSDKKSRSNIYLPYLSRGYNNNYDYNDQMDTKVNKHKGRHKYFAKHKERQQKRAATDENDKVTVRITLENKFFPADEATKSEGITSKEKCVTIDSDKSKTPSTLNAEITKPSSTHYLNISNHDMSIGTVKATEYRIKNFTNFTHKFTKATATPGSIIDKIDTPMTSTLSTATVAPELTSLFGTAEMETLIDELKKRAMAFIIKHNPTISDIISSSVTVATYNAKSSLNFSTNFMTDNAETESQTDLITSDLDTNISDTTKEHNRIARTVTSTITTVPQSISRAGNKVETGIKGMYRKFKFKLKSDFKHEVTQAKDFVSDQTFKIANKVSQTIHPSRKMSHLAKEDKGEKVVIKSHSTPFTPRITNNTVPHRTFRSNFMKPKNNHYLLRSTEKYDELSTKGPILEDDYVMLTLYEQMLNKERDNYFNNLLTTDENINDRRQEINSFIRGFKKRQLEDPSDYNVEDSTQDDTITTQDDSKEGYQNTENNIETPASATSYEDLSKQISYKDYVNGYKHYLNFQKQLGDQNFSAQIRYQAHRHHSVDDIGKYILDKIPEIPNIGRSKRTPEDYSTSKDYSWLRKHLKFLYEASTSKKFHTSETVTLKIPTSTPNSKSTDTSAILTLKSDNKAVRESVSMSEDAQLEDDPSKDNGVDLEKLSEILEASKWKQFDNKIKGTGTTEMTTSSSTSTAESRENTAARGDDSFTTGNVFNKLFKFSKSSNDKEQSKISEESDSRLIDYIPITYNYVNDDDSNGQRVKKSQYPMQSYDADIKYETTSSYTERPVTKFSIPVTHIKQRQLTSTKKRKFRHFFNLFKLKKNHKNSDDKKSKSKRHLLRDDTRVTRFCPFKKLRYWLTCNTKKDHLIVSSTMKSMTDNQLYKSEKYNDVQEIGDPISNISDYKPNNEADYSAPPSDNYVFDWNDFAKDPSPQIDSIEDYPNTISNTLSWTNPSKSLPGAPESRYHNNEADDSFFSSIAKDLTSIFDLTKPTKHRPSKYYTDYLTTFSNEYKFANKDPIMSNMFEPNKDSFINSSDISSPYTYETKGYLSSSPKHKHTKVTTLKASTSSSPSPPYYDINLAEPEILVTTDKSSTEINNSNLYYNAVQPSQKAGHYRLRGLSDVNFYSIPKIQNSVNIDKLYNDHSTNTESSTQSSFNILFHHNKFYSTPPSESTFAKFPTKSSSNTNKTPEDTELRNKTKQPGDDIPDYFNELLVWHGDLLHDDHLETSDWQHMLTDAMSTENNNYSPNLMSLENEVADMKKFLNKMNSSMYNTATTQTFHVPSEKLNEATTKLYTSKKTTTPTLKTTSKNFQKRKYTKPFVDELYTRRFYLKSEHEILRFNTNNKDQMNNNNKIHMYDQQSNDINKNHNSVFDPVNEANSYKTETTTSSTKDKNVQGNKFVSEYNSADALNKLLNDSSSMSKTIKNFQLKTTKNIRYTTKYDQARQADSNVDSKKEADFEKLLLDTTLLAYDDGLSFLMKTKQQKKANKHHTGAVTYGKKDSQNAQINKPQTHPAQYFSTPLPMRSADFEQFLREHSLDVDSVTSSLSNAKTYVDTWSSTKSPEHNKFTSKITTDMTKSKEYHVNYKKQQTKATSSETEKMNSDLNKLDKSLHLAHFKGKEFKEKGATNKFDYMNYLATIENNVTKRSKSYNKIKRKMGMFHKKPTKSEDVLETKALKDSPVAITVITLDGNQDFENDKRDHAINNESPRQSTTYTSSTLSYDDNDNLEEPPYILISNDREDRINTKDIRYVRKHNDVTDKLKPVKAVFDSVSLKITSTPKFVENKEVSEKNNIQKVNNVKESVQTTVIMDNKTTAMDKSKVDDTDKFENQLEVNKGKLQSSYTLPETSTDTTTKHHRHSLIKGLTENLQHVFNIKPKTKTTTYFSTWSMNENGKTQSSVLKVRGSGYQYDGVLDDFDNSKVAIDYDYGQKRYFIDVPETTTESIFKTQFDSETNQDIKQIMSIVDVIEAIENVTRPNVMIHIDLPIYYAPEGRATNSQITYDLKHQPEKSNMTYNTLNSPLTELLNKFGWYKMSVTEKTAGNLISSSSLYLMLLDFINKICLRAPVANLTDGFKSSDFNSDEVFRKSRGGSNLMDYSEKDKHRNIHKKDLPERNTWKSFPTHKAVFIYDLKNIDSSTPIKSRKNIFNYRRDTTKQSIKTNKRHRRHDNSTGGRFIAKNVSGFEIIVDLINNSQSANNKNAFRNTDIIRTKHQNEKKDGNSIQVHISLPYIMDLNSREVDQNETLSLPKCIRKIFSAKLSTDVDLEFQVYTFADATTTPKSVIYGKQELKDLYDMLLSANITSLPLLKQSDIKKIFQGDVRKKDSLALTSENNLNNIEDKKIISKGIDDINRQLLKVYENLTAVAAIIKHITPRNAHEKDVVLKLLDNLNKDHRDRRTRNLKCKAIKKLFNDDRVCCCKCRANKTMCRACAASDAVITEIIFEFDNLSQYMKNHCTEIQTYFFMNPTGGRKLKDSVHRLDNVLNDYYRRGKGKCQGPTCKSLGGMQPLMNVNKRSNDNQSLSDFITLLQSLSSNVELLLDSHNNDEIAKRTKFFIIETKKCFHIPTNDKYEWDRDRRQAELKNVYSVDKFNVNILTNGNRANDSYIAVTDDYKYCRYLNTTHSNGETYITPPESLRDYENIDEVNKSSVSKLGILKRLWPHNIFNTRVENIFTFTEKLYPEESTTMQSTKVLHKKSANIHKSIIKRDLEVEPTQLESPLITDPGGLFWYNYLSKNMVNDVTGKVMVSQINNVALLNTKSTTRSVKPTKKKIPNLGDDGYDIITKNDSLTIYKLYDLISELGDLINLLSSPSSGVMNESNKTIISKQNTTKSRMFLKGERNFITELKTLSLPHVTEDVTIHDMKNTILHSYQSSNLYTDFFKKPTPKDSKKANYTKPVDLIKDTKKVFNISVINSTKTSEKQSSQHKDKYDNKDNGDYTVPVVISDDNVFSRKHVTTSKITKKFNKGNIHQSINNLINDATKFTTTKSTEYVDSNNIQQVDINSYPEFTVEGSNDDINATTYPTIIIIDKSLKKLQEPFDDISESKSNKNFNLLKHYGLNEKDEEQIKHVDNNYHGLFISILNHADRLHEDVNTERLTRTTTPATSLRLNVLHNTPPKYGNIAKWEKSTPSKFVREVTTTKKKCPKKYYKMLKTRPSTAPPHESSKPTHPAVINELPTTAPTTTTTKPTEKETFDPAHPSLGTLCDLQATHDHVLEKYRTLKKDTFCLEAKHIECFKIKPAPTYLMIEQACSKKICKRKPEALKPLKVIHEEPKIKRHNGLRFDWIRRKRSLLSFNEYDTYVRDKYGIYRSSTSKKSRIKRRTDLSHIYDGLRNLPSFDTDKDEMHVLVGDTVTLHCNIDPKCLEGHGEFSEFVWSTDRPEMLKMDNVAIESTTASITSVNVKNNGEYNCSKHGTVLSRIKLNVVTLPKFHIVFIPTYNTGVQCHYDDLTAVSSNLGPEMSNIACERQCTIRIDEPVCMKEQDEAKTALRVIAIMTATPHFNVKCSAQCLRDLHCSFTLLCAANIPPLMEIGLVIEGNEKNRTFPVLYASDNKLIVTHTLRRKDSNQHHEYHKLVSKMQPGDIDVVMSCQAGFELLTKYKICVACPINTFAIEGANRCSPCPPGSRAAHPGSGKCLNVLCRRRRYDWVVQVPLGYSIALCAVLVLCAVGFVGGMASQCTCKGESDRSDVQNQVLLKERDKGHLRARLQAAAPAPPKQARRPLSPSKVILARFFRSSHTSRATDSQETKFGLWRGKNSAPPIPPIDFDY